MLCHHPWSTERGPICPILPLLHRPPRTVKARFLQAKFHPWIEGLCLEIRRAIDAYPAEPSWQPLNSVYFNRTSYYPVLNHMRVLPDGSMEFDVYFYTANSNQRT